MGIPLLHTTPTQRGFVLPENSRLEQPELLYPGRKPVGNVAIDFSNKAAEGLIASWIFNNSFVDIVSGITATTPNGPPDLFRVDRGEFSVKPSPNSAGDKLLITDRRIVDLPLTPFSVLYRAYSIGVHVSNGAMLGWSGTDDIVLYPNAGAGSTAKHRVFWRDAGVTVFDSDDVIPVGWFTYLLTWDGDTVYQYLNGKQQSVSQSFTGAGVGPFTNFGLNYWPGGQYYSADGRLSTVMFFNSPKGKAEAESLTKNPYQVLKPVA